MKEQNTWPGFWENSWNISENSLDSETIKALEKRWLQSNIAKKLWELQWELDTQKIEQVYAEEYPWENKDTEIAQVWDWLKEHKQNIEDLASFERSELRKSLIQDNNIADERSIASSLSQSAKTIWNFWLDLIKWIKDLKNLEAIQYTIAKADWVLTDEELNYKIW